MFTAADRDRRLADLLTYARSDPTVTAAALVGSAARQETDRWSDIDLALRLEAGADPVAAADAWRVQLAHTDEVADHLDLRSGSALYRVFLLADSLQIDLSFWPAPVFAGNGEPFELLFGEAHPSRTATPPDLHSAIGWAWLYALHARPALARGRPWQALQMLDGLRDRVLTLACCRHGVPAHQGRGVDRLPSEVLAAVEDTLVARPELTRLAAAFASGIGLLLSEAEYVDPPLAARLRTPLTTLVDTVS